MDRRKMDRIRQTREREREIEKECERGKRETEIEEFEPVDGQIAGSSTPLTADGHRLVQVPRRHRLDGAAHLNHLQPIL
jgi:hypothetical protein